MTDDEENFFEDNNPNFTKEKNHYANNPDMSNFNKDARNYEGQYMEGYGMGMNKEHGYQQEYGYQGMKDPKALNQNNWNPHRAFEGMQPFGGQGMHGMHGMYGMGGQGMGGQGMGGQGMHGMHGQGITGQGGQNQMNNQGMGNQMQGPNMNRMQGMGQHPNMNMGLGSNPNQNFNMPSMQQGLGMPVNKKDNPNDEFSVDINSLMRNAEVRQDPSKKYFQGIPDNMTHQKFPNQFPQKMPNMHSNNNNFNRNQFMEGGQQNMPQNFGQNMQQNMPQMQMPTNNMGLNSQPNPNKNNPMQHQQQPPQNQQNSMPQPNQNLGQPINPPNRQMPGNNLNIPILGMNQPQTTNPPIMTPSSNNPQQNDLLTTILTQFQKGKINVDEVKELINVASLLQSKDMNKNIPGPETTSNPESVNKSIPSMNPLNESQQIQTPKENILTRYNKWKKENSNYNYKFLEQIYQNINSVNYTPIYSDEELQTKMNNYFDLLYENSKNMNCFNLLEYERDNGQILPEFVYGVIRVYNDLEGYGYLKNESTGADIFFNDIEFMRKLLDIKMLKFKKIRIRCRLCMINTKCKLIEPCIVDPKGNDTTAEYLETQKNFYKKYLTKNIKQCILRASNINQQDEILKEKYINKQIGEEPLEKIENE